MTGTVPRIFCQTLEILCPHELSSCFSFSGEGTLARSRTEQGVFSKMIECSLLWYGKELYATQSTKLELAIPYCVATALPDVGRSICHVVCQREALPRAMLREPQKFGPNIHVNPLFYNDIYGIMVIYHSAEPEINQGLPVFILRVLLIST